MVQEEQKKKKCFIVCAGVAALVIFWGIRALRQNIWLGKDAGVWDYWKK